MGVLIDDKTRVAVQGITGREGQARTKLMTEYGTNVVAGVTPGQYGATVHGVPVYDTMQEAVESEGDIDASVMFVPAPFVRDAALEALDAGVEFLAVIPDHVGVHDALAISARARETDASFIGPNSLGVCTVGEAVLGMIGGQAETLDSWFEPGPIGVASRSGGMTTSTAYYLARRGLGMSTIVHIGGDSVIGMQHPDAVRAFEADEQTEVIVLFGEIGTTQEERVAELIAEGEVTKPVVAYIGGQAAESGTRYSHAGAIVERGEGSHESKVTALRGAGAHVAESFEEVPELTTSALREARE
jgi:succinyl-CoA synthetase alpha subunit